MDERDEVMTLPDPSRAARLLSPAARELAAPCLLALYELKIRCVLYAHEPYYTMEECAHIGANLGALHMKSLFLCDRRGSVYCLFVTARDKALRTSALSKALGTSRLSFASEALLREILGVKSGALSALSLINDTAGRDMLAIDEDVLAAELICLHPMTNEATVVMSMRDLLELFLPYAGHKPVFVSL